MKCPECAKVLIDVATSCRCGWQKGGETGREFIPCAHELCNQTAMCRVKTATGWARLCLGHYSEHYGEQGKRTMTALGLDRWPDESRADWSKRVREYWKLMARKSRIGKAPYEEAA